METEYGLPEKVEQKWLVAEAKEKLSIISGDYNYID